MTIIFRPPGCLAPKITWLFNMLTEYLMKVTPKTHRAYNDLISTF